MEPIDPFWEPENFDEKAVFLEIVLDEWPALRRMSEEEKGRIYVAITSALRAIDCRVEAINASELALRLVMQMSEKYCVNDILDAIESASKSAVPHLVREDEEWIGSCDVETRCPTNVAAAVVNIGGKPPSLES